VTVSDAALRSGTATVSVIIAQPQPRTLAPSLSALKISPAAFRAASGATVSYRDTAASTTTFTVTERRRACCAGTSALRCLGS
jgi:hypothetical protein